MAILRYESDEVTSNFRGVCPLCGIKVDFTVEKKGRFDEPVFSCPSCEAVWMYWEDWEKPPKMKGARLVKADSDGRGVELTGAYLETSFWQSVIDEKAAIGKFEPSVKERLRWKMKPRDLRRLKPSKTAPEEQTAPAEAQTAPSTKPSPETLTVPPTQVPGEAPAAQTYPHYGFEIDYPQGWQVIRGRQSSKSGGELTLEGPREIKIDVFWGPLAETKKKYPTPAQFVDSALEVIRGRSYVTALDVKDRRTVELGGHEAIFSHFTVDITQYSILLKKSRQNLDSCSLLVYCEESQRYFVFSGQTSLGSAQELDEIFASTMRSFNCHPQP